MRACVYASLNELRKNPPKKSPLYHQVKYNCLRRGIELINTLMRTIY